MTDKDYKKIVSKRYTKAILGYHKFSKSKDEQIKEAAKRELDEARILFLKFLESQKIC